MFLSFVMETIRNQIKYRRIRRLIAIDVSATRVIYRSKQSLWTKSFNRDNFIHFLQRFHSFDVHSNRFHFVLRLKIFFSYYIPLIKIFFPFPFLSKSIHIEHSNDISDFFWFGKKFVRNQSEKEMSKRASAINKDRWRSNWLFFLIVKRKKNLAIHSVPQKTIIEKSKKKNIRWEILSKWFVDYLVFLVDWLLMSHNRMVAFWSKKKSMKKRMTFGWMDVQSGTSIFAKKNSFEKRKLA